jgi:formylglycine-generating enzyme required for sulfatase activity
VDWLLRRWGQEKQVRAIDLQLAANQKSPIKSQKSDGRWYVNGQGQTFAIIRDPEEFLMGSPHSEPDRLNTERLHRRRIPRSFAIATKEVTVEQFQRFLRDHPEVRHNYTKRFSPDPDGPMISVRWYDAAMYCNWLSKAEGMLEDQWCYLPNAKGEFADGMRIKPNYLSLQGYRLPTEAEWEYACRADAATSRYYGHDESILPQYAWYKGSAKDRAWPVGRLKPNELGLFDGYGNVLEWCQGIHLTYPRPPAGRSVEDIDNMNTLIVLDKDSRVLRGGSFLNQPSEARSANRLRNLPHWRSPAVGIRPARTYD